MPDGALFIGWGALTPGREPIALEVFNEAKEFYATLQRKGDIESFEPVILSQAGDQLRGFFLLRGDPLKLSHLTTREDFIRLSAKAALVVENLMILPAFIGNAVPKMLEANRLAIKALTLQAV